MSLVIKNGQSILIPGLQWEEESTTIRNQVYHFQKKIPLLEVGTPIPLGIGNIKDIVYRVSYLSEDVLSFESFFVGGTSTQLRLKSTSGTVTGLIDYTTSLGDNVTDAVIEDSIGPDVNAGANDTITITNIRIDGNPSLNIPDINITNPSFSSGPEVLDDIGRVTTGTINTNENIVITPSSELLLTSGNSLSNVFIQAQFTLL